MFSFVLICNSMLAPFFIFSEGGNSLKLGKTYSFLRFLAMSHLLDEHHFFTDFGCQHEARNPLQNLSFEGYVGLFGSIFDDFRRHVG